MLKLTRDRRRRVVIADDDRGFVEYLAALVDANELYEVVGLAADGEEAVQLAIWQDADVVLMDIDMPRIDGLRATQLLRKSRSRVCVLLVSGVEDDRIEQAQSVGAIGLIAKSAGPDAIERALAEFVSGSPEANAG
jgi:DNA-binding NarL/FixJ family response regulator